MAPNTQKIPASQLVKTFLTGGAAFAIALMIGGNYYPGYQLDSTAAESIATAKEHAVTAALAPICAEKFKAAADVAVQTTSLSKERSWERGSFIEKGGWATFPGNKAPNSNVATACAELLTKT